MDFNKLIKKMTVATTLTALSILALQSVVIAQGKTDSSTSCRFALKYKCEDFSKKENIQSYLSNVMYWEGKFMQEGIGFDKSSGYTYDGHPINYSTGELFGEPHLFSAPSKESIHLALLALALDGSNPHALQLFDNSIDRVRQLLHSKIDGYLKFNQTYPGFGCWTPWVGFDTNKGTFDPLESWSTPYYKVPGLDNGEWFWAVHAVADLLNHPQDTIINKDSLNPDHAKEWKELATKFNSFLQCQKDSAKMIYYRGNGDVSATVYIKDAFVAPHPDNYFHCDGYLNDPYEGETMTQLLYLYSQWASEEERDLLWQKKRGLFQKVDYIIPDQTMKSLTADLQISLQANRVITVQRGYWFSTHEQWKALLLPYVDDDLPLVKKIFRNAEKARVWDAYSTKLPGLMASINDVTNGTQEIPDYASACGIESIAFEEVQRRDLMTPYGAYGLFLHDMSTALCWYNNMLSGPRMQSAFGSTEAINANSTEISPLTTWDSKITTVLAMLQGIGAINKRAMQRIADIAAGDSLRAQLHETIYDRFHYIVEREHRLLFGSLHDVKGDNVPFVTPNTAFNFDTLNDWKLSCA